jgi:hypothetical protein
MLRADGGKMPDQVGFGHGRQHRRPVLVALAAADDDLVGPKVRRRSEDGVCPEMLTLGLT